MAINCHVILAVFMWLIMEIIGIWFIEEKLNIDPQKLNAARWTYQFSLLTFCFSIIQTPFNSNIIAHEKMNFYAIISIVEVFLKLVVVYLLTIGNFDKLILYAILITVVSIVVLIVYVIYCTIVLSDCKYIRYWNKSIIKQFSSYSGWSLLVNSVDITTAQCISIFFNLFIGVIANAALGVANQVLAAINQFLSTFTQAFNPQIIKSYAAKDYEYFMKLIYSTSKLSYFLLFFIAFPAILNIKFLLRLWLGDYPEMAPTFVTIMMVYFLIDSLQAPLWQAVHATGQLKVHQIMVASIKITSIPLMYIILKYTGLGSLALIGWVGINLVTSIARTIYMKHLINLSLKKFMMDVVLKAIMVTIVSIPVPIIVVMCIGEESFWGFILSSLVAVIITSFSIYLLGTNSAEKLIIKTIPIINKIIKEK